MGHLRISSFQELGSLSDQGLGQGGGSLGQLRIQTHPVLGSAGGGSIPQGSQVVALTPMGSEMFSSWNQDNTAGRGQAYNPELLSAPPRSNPLYTPGRGTGCHP